MQNEELQRPFVAVHQGCPAKSNAGELSDEQIVEQIRQGQLDSFSLLVQRHEAKVFQLAFFLVRNECDARDIAQEAFLRVFRKAARFEGVAAFYTWLYRIVYNLSIDTLRRPYRGRVRLEQLESILGESAEEAMPHGPNPSPDEVVRRRELALRISQALSLLSTCHRDVIIMREVWGMSYGEIAERMECAKGTIMSRLFHARQRLQSLLREVYDEEFSEAPPSAPSFA